MAKKQSSIAINLLSTKSFEASPVGQTFNWALRIGKLILFGTFLIIIIALLIRFSLDRKVDQLAENIESNTDIIQQLGDTEIKIRKLQNRLDNINTLTKDDQSLTEAINLLEHNLPKTAVLETITLNQQQLSFEGTVPNETVFSNMLASLQIQPQFSEIVIDELSSGGLADPEISFSIKLSCDLSKNEL